MVKYEVPFYSNTPDDTRCVPAVFRMVLKYFSPDKEFTWEDIDKLTGHVQDKGTWYFPALTEMVKMGFKIKCFGTFDYEKLYKFGQEYLKEYYSDNQAAWYIQHSDVIDKRGLVPEFLKTVEYVKRTPNMEDVTTLLHEGFLEAAEIDACILNQKDGYAPHFVLIIGEDKNNLAIHDPGLPALEGRIVNRNYFISAWNFAGEGKRNLVAFKR